MHGGFERGVGGWEVRLWGGLVSCEEIGVDDRVGSRGSEGSSGWVTAAAGVGRGAVVLTAPVDSGRGPGVVWFLLRTSLSLSIAAISSLRW